MRNVRRRQIRQAKVISQMFEAPVQNVAPMERRLPVTMVPGGQVNPVVEKWYFENAFESRPKPSYASRAFPSLFGPMGLYPLAYDECDEECMNEFGECFC